MDPISRQNMKKEINLLDLRMVSPVANLIFEFRFGFLKEQHLTCIL
jgi:hypothetical protein